MPCAGLVHRPMSAMVWQEGNYTGCEADRKRRLGEEAAQPHRIRHKPITR